jgi:hypothetical protein
MLVDFFLGGLGMGIIGGILGNKKSCAEKPLPHNNKYES